MSKKSLTVGRNASWKKDKRGVYIEANETYAEIAGLDSPYSIIGKTDFDMPWRKLADEFRAGDQLVMDGMGTERLFAVEQEISADGILDILVREEQLRSRATGEIIGVVGSFKDITGFSIQPKDTSGYFDEKKKRYYLPKEFGDGEYLTRAQARVLEKVGAGWTAPRIAAHFGTSVSTIHVHIVTLKEKLGASSKSDLSVISNEHGVHFALMDIKALLVPNSGKSEN
jgi:DNA-binding CsgD family transcriptional regulator